MKKIRFIIFTAILFGSVQIGHALTLTPVRIEVQGDPGQSLTEEMTLVNEQGSTITYYSSFSNFEAQGDTGSPAFVEPTDDIGTWMKTAESITLSAGESKTVRILITIPSDAEPGGHFGAVFWGTAAPNATPGQVAISAKTGMLVLLSVNGEVKEAGGLIDFNTKDKKFWYNTLPVSFEYRFKNDGGDRVKPSGKITIRDTIYIRAARLDANPVEGNVLPSSIRKFKVDWIKHAEAAPAGFLHTVGYQWKNFALGLYSAHIDLVYGSQAQHTKKVVWFFVFPWQLVIVLIFVLWILWWGGKKLLKRYNRFIIEKARVTSSHE